MTRAVRVVFLILIVLIAVLTATAHKGGAESSESSKDYKITFGILPAQIVVGKEQLIYLRVESSKDRSPVEGLRAVFSISRTGTPETSEEYGTEELLEGQYILKHIFTERGNYNVVADLFDGHDLVITTSKQIHVEPNGPSLLFWMYMLVAVIVGAIIASRSHL